MATIDAWFETQAAQRRSEKRHKYDLAEFGLTRDKVDAAFSHYHDFLSSSGIRSSMLLK